MPVLPTLLHFEEDQASAQRIADGAGMARATISRHRFPDGELKLRLPTPLPARVVILRTLNDPNEKLLELLLVARTARTLGANRRETFLAITLPLALPAILASLLFAFMSSFDEVTATLFWLPANTQTVTTQIMAMLQFSVDQKINALAALLILGSVILAFVALELGRRLSADERKPRGNST